MGSVRAARPPRRAAALTVAVALGCAGAAPGAAPAFSGVRSVALVRRPEHAERRAKDPLDAVAESLAAKGITVRLIELGGHDEPKDVARLFDEAESRASSGGGGGSTARGAALTLGEDAGRTVRRLGVDAVVTYHHLEFRVGRTLGDPSLSPPGAGMGGGTYSPRSTAPSRPLGALEVVGTDGQGILFDWGDRDEVRAGGAETPAEAVDAVVRALLGEPAEPDAA